MAGLLSALLVVVRPEAVGAEALLAAGLIAAVVAIAVVLRTVSAPRAAVALPTAGGFAALRVLLRASDPAAPGHRRARAPGTTR
jgi:hypothetical protein